MDVPRLRVFAGPNGSGKSTIKGVLRDEQLYSYVNADDLEREAKQSGSIDLAAFSLCPRSKPSMPFISIIR